MTVGDETDAAVDATFGFTGRERDEESDLYYYRARYYDPALGRFLSEDPLGFEAGDANLTRYVGNDPVGKVDPSGLEEPGNQNEFDFSPKPLEVDPGL
ncbi:MAG TPA: RHS repeat-associated core domain-containing protein, partial [Planctomycetaceae bacterium]|nr:RHS repeat-associated core domain-containing protein [Planctomycetaceae bacterium]